MHRTLSNSERTTWCLSNTGRSSLLVYTVQCQPSHHFNMSVQTIERDGRHCLQYKRRTRIWRRRLEGSNSWVSCFIRRGGVKFSVQWYHQTVPWAATVAGGERRARKRERVFGEAPVADLRVWRCKAHAVATRVARERLHNAMCAPARLRLVFVALTIN